jgi:hypothetical protein
MMLSIPINMADRLKEYAFQHLPYPDLIAKASWVRPQKLNEVAFDLKVLAPISRTSRGRPPSR